MWEAVLPIYGWAIVASVVYSFWVATALQGCWGAYSLTGKDDCSDTLDGTLELGWPILVNSLVPIGLTFLLDLIAGRWMDPGWRIVTGGVGVLVAWAAYSSNPALSPWIVGAGWMIGQLIELATGSRSRS